MTVIDWSIVILYLAFAFAVGLYVKGEASSSKESYFLAGRGLPWWWAGTSIAATTFAADTPLAVTGIIANRGISGNWLWLSWLGVYAAVAIYFAERWQKSDVLTDAEFIALRYKGAAAATLRYVRASLYAVVYNCIILGWVLCAMVKIIEPFFQWEEWFPTLYATAASFWPQDSNLGTPSEAFTIVALVLFVGVYSSLGGIRGVIFTDVIQFFLALFASIWFAAEAWSAIGGSAGLEQSLAQLYGPAHSYLDLFPRAKGGWLSAVGISTSAFIAYTVVQAYSNVPADGGGYFMQRLSTTRSPHQARGAATLFLLVQYTLRVWPWLMVGLAALVLIPLGGESQSLSGAGAPVGADRELAYPVLMRELLPVGVLGMLLASLLAAFMSTVDTHLNWGASYLVHDIFGQLFPNASTKAEIRVARTSVFFFVIAGVFMSLQISSIEQAWRWVAFLGASLWLPTLLRWLYWRVSATVELVSLSCGIASALVAIFMLDLAYEWRLIITSTGSLAGLLIALPLFGTSSAESVEDFYHRVEPLGCWPRPAQQQDWLPALLREGGLLLIRWLCVVGGLLLLLKSGYALIITASWTGALLYLGTACLLLPLGLTKWLQAGATGRT